MALVASGISLNEASKRLDVSRAAIRAWRDNGIEPATGGAPCFRCDGHPTPDPSGYAVLFGYYLGDGYLARARTTFVLRISCDPRYPRIIDAIEDVIERTHPGAGVGRVRAPGTIVVQNSWKHWPCLFPQHGPGRKHERALSLAPWQQEIVAAYPAELLRGLFHSDGCRSNNWATRTVAGERKRYDYPRWQFTNNSEDIQAWCCEALDRLEVPWRQSSWKTVSVSTRAGVETLDALLGLKS
jgi:hypothetical protein